MKAYRLTKWGAGTGELLDVARPEPGPRQVLLKVAGNGLCASDLHAMDAEAPPAHLDVELPLTLGHEVAGWIEALGPGVDGFEIGQPCLVTIGGCERCHMCAQGWNNYCLSMGKQIGMGMDGGLAEYAVARANSLVPLRNVEPWKAAPLTDAGLSSYHAVRRALPLMTPDATVLVIGVGGLGHMAVEVMRQITGVRKIIAADPSEQARQLAAERGADLCLPSDETTAKRVLEEVGPRRVDVVLDFVGMGVTMKMACEVVRAMGHIVVAGRGRAALEFKHDAMPYGASISTTFGGSKLELMHLVSLAEAGKIKPHVTKYKLSDVQTAVGKLRAGKVVGRAIVVPDGH